jgi:hypothetical protein
MFMGYWDEMMNFHGDFMGCFHGVFMGFCGENDRIVIVGGFMVA